MTKLLSVITFFSLFIFSSCNSEQSKPINRNNIPSILDSAPEKDILVVWTDELEIRAKPILESSALAKVKKDEKVVYTGEQTGFRDTITLKGQTFIEPWIKVQTAKNRIGWVYRGAIRKPGGAKLE